MTVNDIESMLETDPPDVCHGTGEGSETSAVAAHHDATSMRRICCPITGRVIIGPVAHPLDGLNEELPAPFELGEEDTSSSSHLFRKRQKPENNDDESITSTLTPSFRPLEESDEPSMLVIPSSGSEQGSLPEMDSRTKGHAKRYSFIALILLGLLLLFFNMRLGIAVRVTFYACIFVVGLACGLDHCTSCVRGSSSSDISN